MTDLKELTLETLAGGAVPELFARELAAVLANINDPNTKAKKTRKITLEVLLTPISDDRGSAWLQVGVKSSLASVRPVEGAIHLVRRGGKLVAFGKDPNQMDLPMERPVILEGGANAQS